MPPLQLKFFWWCMVLMVCCVVDYGFTFRFPINGFRRLSPMTLLDVTTTSWSRPSYPATPTEISEQSKDQSVRKLLDMLNSRSISPRQAKRSFETVLMNWPDFELSETGWYRLLDGAIRWRFPGFAIRIFDVMNDQGVMCPSYLMTSLLQLVSMSGMNDAALRLFDSAVATGFEPSVHNFSPLLKSCGTAHKARELLQRMEFVGIQANVISYTAAIKSCENTGDWRSALELLDLMRAASVVPNEITYCCVINVASRGLAGDMAVNVLREMLDLGFPPNLLCYGSALTACAKVGMWNEVETLLAEMEQYGMPLQESVIISVINSCRGQGQRDSYDRTDRPASSIFPTANVPGTREDNKDSDTLSTDDITTATATPQSSSAATPQLKQSQSAATTPGIASWQPFHLREQRLQDLPVPGTGSLSTSTTTATPSSSTDLSLVDSPIVPRETPKPVALTVEETELRQKASVCQWSRTMWIIEKYGLKVANVTESMYTMAMDVCEGVKRYREVLSLFHLMLEHRVMPSKSSFTFALRACSALQNGEEAVRCIRAAQKHHGTASATAFMYNSTIVLLDTMNRNDLAVKVYRDLIAAGAQEMGTPEEEWMAFRANGNYYISHPTQPQSQTWSRTASKLWSGSEYGSPPQSSRDSSYVAAMDSGSSSSGISDQRQQQIPSGPAGVVLPSGETPDRESVGGGGLNEVVSARETSNIPPTAMTMGHRVRLPPSWMTRRILSNALMDLTDNFSAYFTEIKNGQKHIFDTLYNINLLTNCRLAASKATQPFVKDVTELLRETIYDKSVFLLPSAYPMANKLVLDSGDTRTLRSLLNQTLCKRDVNSTRLYDFALKILVRENPTKESLDTILGFVADVYQYGYVEYAAYLLVDAMNRLLNSRLSDHHAADLMSQRSQLAESQRDPWSSRVSYYPAFSGGGVFHADEQQEPGSGRDSTPPSSRTPSSSTSSASSMSSQSSSGGGVDTRDSSIKELARAALIFYIFENGREIFKVSGASSGASGAGAGAGASDTAPSRTTVSGGSVTGSPGQVLTTTSVNVNPTVSAAFPRKAYNIAAYICKRADDPKLAMSVYRIAREDNADDRMLRNIIIHTLARSADHWDTAIEILEDVPKPDLFMYNSALIACNTGRDWEQAIYLLTKMQEDGHQLSTVVVTSAIAACSTCGQADEALRLLDMMEERDIPRSVWTFNAAMSACAKSGRWKDALSVFEKMRDIRTTTTISTTSTSTNSTGNTIVEDEGRGKGTRLGTNVVVGNGTSSLDPNNEHDDSDNDGDNDLAEISWDGNPPLAESDVNIKFQNDAEGDRLEEDGEDEGDEEDDDEEEEEEGEESDEGEGLFRSMRGIANRVTFNTLIEALGQGGQGILVDELYREAVDSGVVSPLRSFEKGLIDLHGHSSHMAVAALRYTFDHMLEREAERLKQQSATDSVKRKKLKELTVIVGKGGKLASVIQRELTDEFRPPIRSYVSKTNAGRLLLSEKDLTAWMSIHRRS